MKKISVLIILSVIIVAASMVYLVFSGISLRSAPLIQPSVISTDHRNIATSVVHRLFQELQGAHYLLWGVLPVTEVAYIDSQIILKLTAEEYEKTFHQPVQFIYNAEKATAEQIHACAKPCWLLVSNTRAHQLENNSFIESTLLPLERTFMTLTVVGFNRNETVAEECKTQKRLSFSCLISVSIREVQRKMKDPRQHYFFLRKYNESDYFLFVQKIN